jgi:predicted phage-related endonuclease
LERVTAFWVKNVQADIPPDGVPSLEIVRLRRRETGKVISLPATLVTRWRALETARKEAERAEDEAKAAVLAEMADAEVGESEAGSVKISRIKSERLDTKALKAAHPDIAAQFVKESESVRITYQKQKLLKG